MEIEALGLAQDAGRTIDFSMVAMFTRSTVMVKAVTISLILASVWGWAVIVDKWLAFRRARREAALFEDAFWSGQPLDALFDRIGTKPRSAIERVFVAGMAEWRRSYDGAGALIPGSAARIERALDVALAREGEALGSRLSVLATVGAVAPFVGLFGTVWGIMTAFERISIEQNTNLATVAPGIAEALVTTAIGLIAAVPAVIFYNVLSAEAQRAGARLEAFADEFSVILSRQMQRGTP
ncbi:MAG: protein TolQ [Rubrimonas sp.]|uniref:protein TolQ n=1 Tax=Rubrimonas sp. TaxID=2036015 RepID=UPI002FDE8A96